MKQQVFSNFKQCFHYFIILSLLFFFASLLPENKKIFMKKY